MTLNDFQSANALFNSRKVTAYLQGGLSATGTWEYLPPYAGPWDDQRRTVISITDANGTRTVVPIETITALREVPELTSKRA